MNKRQGVVLGVLSCLVVLGVCQIAGERPGAPRGEQGERATAQAPRRPRHGALSISGRVWGPDGPVPGAKVFALEPPRERLEEVPCRCELWCPRPLREHKCNNYTNLLAELTAERWGELPPLASATADAEGRFQLQELASGPCMLWAESGQLIGQRAGVEAGTQGVELRVAPGRYVEGTVSDDWGAPISGAAISALAGEQGRFFETLSDAQGHFELGPLPGGSYPLVFSAQGHFPQSRLAHLSSSYPLQVTLHSPISLTGRVLREGLPVRGARISLLPQVVPAAHLLQILTNSEGQFLFQVLPPGRYLLLAEFANHHASAEVTLAPRSNDSYLELSLQPGAVLYVSGRITDTLGRPLEGAWASLQGEEERGGWLGRRAWTDSEGHYQLGPFPPGSYPLRCDASRYLEQVLPVGEARESPERADCALAPASLVEGSVIDRQGQPVSGVEVLLQGPGTDETLFTTYTQERGTFLLEASRVGSYRVSVRRRGRVVAEASTRAPVQGLRLLLSKGASLEVEVVDEESHPVSQAQVRLMGEGAQRLETVLTDSAGRGTLSGLAAGRYRLVAVTTIGETTRGVERGVEVADTEAAVAIRLALEAGTSLTGTVVDEAGRPVEGATVWAEPFSPTEQAGAVQPVSMSWRRRELLRAGRTRSGPQGRFALHHLPAGRLWVQVQYPGYRLRVPPQPGLDDPRPSGQLVGADTRAVRLALQPLARIRGRVVRENGLPVTQFLLNEEPVRDPKGAFALPVDEPGEWQLALSSPGLARVCRRLRVPSDEDVDVGRVVLEPGQTLRGRVVDAVTQAPVAGASVEVASGGNCLGEGDRVTTQGNGHFVLQGLGRGIHSLYIYAREHSPRQVRLEAGQQEALLTLERGSTIEGLVVAGGEPLQGGRLTLSFDDHQGRREAEVGEQGRYRLAGVPPGRHELEVWAPVQGEYQSVLLREVEVPAQGTLRLDLTVAPAGSEALGPGR